MTATDELRRLLDERGVEHDDSFGATEFYGEGDSVVVAVNSKSRNAVLYVNAYLTPAQAVEATLGKRECICRDESGGDPCLFICSYCDAEFNHPEDEPINYCPNYGRKVVDA